LTALIAGICFLGAPRINRVQQLNPRAELIECVHYPLYFEDIFTGERHSLDFVRGRKAASFSGIAQPESFDNKLTELGAEIVLARRFADHHRFTQQEVLEAINRGIKRRAELVLTTQKDAVRFPKLDRRDLQVVFMRVEKVTGSKFRQQLGMASVVPGEGHPVAGVGWRASGVDMRMARIKLKGETAVYHCLFQIVGG